MSGSSEGNVLHFPEGIVRPGKTHEFFVVLKVGIRLTTSSIRVGHNGDIDLDVLDVRCNGKSISGFSTWLRVPTLGSLFAPHSIGGGISFGTAHSGTAISLVVRNSGRFTRYFQCYLDYSKSICV